MAPPNQNQPIQYPGPDTAVIYSGPYGQLPGLPQPVCEPYIDKYELARRLGRTVRSVDTYMAKGMLPFYKLGRTVAFKWTEVDAHFRAHFRVCVRSR